ncbi:MAG: DUF1573 domain-containing protein [Muribaculaceae bacterium]|nr:DUF1573 domain-containing protein [Muribaculaceae bacterium]
MKPKKRTRALRKPAVLYALPAALFIILAGCKDKELRPAEVIIEDPYRHYYPVIQGETLPVVYEIENISEEPLVIQEVQTSCGCLIPADDLPIVVLPGKKGRIRLGYNSIKNTGEVQHQVYLYGNFTDSLYRELSFDTHVVPPADYTRDYEDLWREQQQRGDQTIRDLVDGNADNKGYYTDDHGDPRENLRRERQKKADELLNF